MDAEQAKTQSDVEVAKSIMELVKDPDLAMEPATQLAIMALAHAVIAQAAALERLADIAEGYAALYLDPAIIATLNARGHAHK